MFKAKLKHNFTIKLETLEEQMKTTGLWGWVHMKNNFIISLRMGTVLSIISHIGRAACYIPK